MCVVLTVAMWWQVWGVDTSDLLLGNWCRWRSILLMWNCRWLLIWCRDRLCVWSGVFVLIEMENDGLLLIGLVWCWLCVISLNCSSTIAESWWATEWSARCSCAATWACTAMSTAEFAAEAWELAHDFLEFLFLGVDELHFELEWNSKPVKLMEGQKNRRKNVRHFDVGGNVIQSRRYKISYHHEKVLIYANFIEIFSQSNHLISNIASAKKINLLTRASLKCQIHRVLKLHVPTMLTRQMTDIEVGVEVPDRRRLLVLEAVQLVRAHRMSRFRLLIHLTRTTTRLLCHVWRKMLHCLARKPMRLWGRLRISF